MNNTFKEQPEAMKQSIETSQEISRKVGRPRGSDKGDTIKYLNEDELKKLFRTAKRESHRDYLFLKLSYILALRVSETVSLRKEDIDAELKTINVQGTKDGKKKLYGLDDPGYNEIWKKLRKELKKKSNSEWLFPSNRRDSHITLQAGKNIFKKYAKKAELRSELSVHSLRHSCGVAMAKRGLSPLMIKDWLRHKSALSTRVYYEQAEFEHTASIMSQVFNRV